MFGYYVCLEFTTDTDYFSQLVQRGKSCLVSVCVLRSLEILVIFLQVAKWSELCLVTMCIPCSLQILFFSQVVQTERVVYVRSACVF